MSSPDRYEPLPGILEIPGWLLRKVPPERRRAVGVAIALAVAALVAALVAVAIDARSDLRERRAADDRTRAERTAERRARDQRAATPHAGTGPAAAAGLEEPEALRARRRLVARLEAAVLADARARARRGEIEGAAQSVSCARYPKSLDAPPPQDDLSTRAGTFECIAALDELRPSEQTSGSLIGHPFRARVDFERGRFAWCRIVQRPGELSFQAEPVVKVPRACGGS